LLCEQQPQDPRMYEARLHEYYNRKSIRNLFSIIIMRDTTRARKRNKNNFVSSAEQIGYIWIKISQVVFPKQCRGAGKQDVFHIPNLRNLGSWFCLQISLMVKMCFFSSRRASLTESAPLSKVSNFGRLCLSRPKIGLIILQLTHALQKLLLANH